MKFIFDFDDVLFYNTRQFKPHMFSYLQKIGIAPDTAREYYAKVRVREFSLKNFISTLAIREKIDKNPEDAYKEIMSQCRKFVNTELINLIKKSGKENCFLITNGEKEYQGDKIIETGIDFLFSQIIIVPGSKKEAVEKLCSQYKNEKV